MASASFLWCLDFVLDHEGGLSMDPADPGNWTGGEAGSGELKGTNMGISAAAYPDLDIANLNRIEVAGIYELDYWRPLDLDGQPVDVALAVFDFGVNSGVARAQRFWRDTGNYRDFMAARLRFYTRLTSLFPRYGRGWVNRAADLLDFTSDVAPPPGLAKVERFFLVIGGFTLPLPYRKASVVGDKLYVRVVGD